MKVKDRKRKKGRKRDEEPQREEKERLSIWGSL